ncbi:hypothetical protein HN865_02815 [Candidatus Woesearchaeota archaeon]|jgi:hypothetical protein|nr:hypothetical protein [Candidatus Woesearchaeota archaeon]MBT7237768.1 hypothetical protein [Candidatus Woesearchaeota archaeon]
MNSKSRWKMFKETVKIAAAIILTFWQYNLWKEKKELEKDNVYYQKEF